MTTIRTMRRWVFGAGTAVALGFGAAQAVAAPAPAADGRAVCDDQVCNRVCQAIGAFGGFCNAGGGCSCWIAP